MNKKIFSITMLALVFMLAIACSPAGSSDDPAAPYYPTYTAIAQGLIDLANTATVQAAMPVLTPMPAGGTENVKREDGSAKYTDYDAGFEIVIPAGWIAVRPGNQEFEDTLANEGSQNQGLLEQMQADKESQEAGSDRLFMYVVKPDIVDYPLQGFGKIAWDNNDTKPLDNAALQELTQSLPSAIPGLRIVSSSITTNSNDVTVLVLGGKFTIDDATGQPVTFYMNVIFFKPDENSTVRLTTTYLDAYRDILDKDFSSSVESMVVFK